MFRDFLANKWVLGGIGFLIVLSVACVFWYRYDTADERQSAADAAQFVRQLENQKANTDKEIDQAAKTFFPGETARKLAEGKNRVVFHPDEPPKPKGKNQQISVSETIKQADTTQEETTQADTGVSPYGFGPYPEIPADCPYPIEWEFPGSNANHELMQRVAIELWNQGIETMGATMEDGLVYPNYIDTVYIRWAETVDDDDNPIQYINELGGYPPACQRIVENNIARLGERGAMTAADIPSDVTVKLYDEDGIDPYTFLNLPKK